ncbi:MAG: hypothetical protein A2Y57_02685 [Candidatus Woykebacteria bacterium RBG_13_40_7b]|uniref:Uncharacterized protein n=1 Tax=Candidatus Woykebacteria bacterium RBG_13_40_7b TaxID=1802594 RepID=A0A1G1WBG9_9BACT|nr:MAG: hypothetical protein A2Y57_02685 [Candidatus Woykebacteria bacterium RBG_13_40_7b]
MIAYPGFLARYSNYLQRPETKNYLNIGLTLALSIILILFALIPTGKTIVTLTQKLEVAKTTDSKLQTKLNHLQEAQNNYQGIKDSLTIILETLPDSPDLQTYLSNLEDLAKGNSVNLDSVQFSDIVLAEKIGTVSAALPKGTNVSFSFSISGAFQNIKNFISNLEGQNRVTELQEVNFAPKGKGDETSASFGKSIIYFFK